MAFSLEFLHLHYQGLTPMLRWADLPELSGKQMNAIPLRRNQIVQWHLHLPASATCQKISLKLGTGGRINHCQLELTMLPAEFSASPPSLITSVVGSKIEDNQWTEFHFPHSIPSGNYWCQLKSPDADEQNTLFLWLTTEKPFSEPIFDSQAYQLTPILKLPTDIDRQIETITSLPLGSKMVQWHIDWNSQNHAITQILIKLGTCGRINHCQLILTLLSDTKRLDNSSEITTIHLNGEQVVDNQWTPINLKQPLTPGKYRCRLHSPNADDLNTIFLWFTIC